MLNRLFLLALIIGGSYYFFQESDFSLSEGIKEVGEKFQMNGNIESQEPIQSDVANEEETSPSENQATGSFEMTGELAEYMGENSDALVRSFGEPIRKDPSSYGYESWIYTDEHTQYIEFGIENGVVNMIYAAGEELSIDPAQIGQSYEQIDEEFNLTEEISFSYQDSTYRFQLNEEDMKMRPIIQLDDETFLQFYFDTFEDKLSSVRFLNTNIALIQRPYEIFYQTQLPTQPELNLEEWEAIQVGMEQQVFELTNVFRHQYGAGSLRWDDSAAKVAAKHSQDMYENDYFSHYSLNGNGLKERLRELNVQYFSAGENIAAQYTDGPAAVEGWLNSEGHREALLNDSYTHLGVGVHRYFYTQNFLQKS